MWPKQFNFFKDFMREISTLFVFNTIKNSPNGLTYYDLTQFGNIPHSKIYRLMKNLEENGDLIKKDDISSETGRPKHLYFLKAKIAILFNMREILKKRKAIQESKIVTSYYIYSIITKKWLKRKIRGKFKSILSF